ncbi:MAG: helix-turn-helix domain-containing protein [Kiritimatiellaeota bacterium]|nr:helix-turn-helix domain-containing protein [Kiritimatiellota bacterium]
MPFAWLARITALSRSSIWRFERGDGGMTVSTLVRLREAYGCTWDDLLGGCESNIVKERRKFASEVVREV